MQTLLLDRGKWDICADANGDIALASNPYSTAQDAASAIKLFKGELWYDTTQGVPYFGQILGERPPLQFLKSKFNAAALSVPEVKTAQTTITSFTNRQLSGQVRITDVNSQTVVMNFVSKAAVWDQTTWDQVQFS